MYEAERAPHRRVLLVDDEPGLQEAFALVLELEGFSVARANDGREALAYLAGNRPDLIVTDYMMPHMNGVELIQQIRANADLSAIPILLMSAALPPTLNSTVANAVLHKPVGIKQFLSVVNDLLISG